MGQRVRKEDIIAARKAKGDRPSLSDAFVQLKADGDEPSIKTLRLIGYPYSFKEHTAYKRNPADPKNPVKAPFPDADTNKAFTRVCTEDDPRFGACKYCELGYRKTTRYSQRCLERFKDENGKPSFKVKILSKGASIFDQFANFEKTASELNAEDGTSDSCEFLGGEVAHDIRIKSEANEKALGGYDHTIAVINNKKSVVTEEEQEAILALYNPTDEEFDQLVALELASDDEPRWFVGGYKLHEIHRPSRPPQAEAAAATPTSDLTVDESANDDDVEEEAPAAKAPAKAAKAAPKKPAAASDDEELDPFANADFSADPASLPF